MIESLDWVYEKGSNETNEDEYVIHQRSLVYAVIDGATGLGGLSGKIAATALKEGLANPTGSKGLFDKVMAANEQLGEFTAQDSHKTIDQVPKEERSSCGLAAIQIHPGTNQLEYVHAGDCMLFVQFRDGSIRTLTYDHISPLDAIAITARQKEFKRLLADGENPNTWAQEEISTMHKNIRQSIYGILVENRRKLNSMGGYGILDGSKDAKHYIEKGTISLNQVRNILLLTDGLQLPAEKAGGQESWVHAAKYAFNHGLNSLYHHISRLEESDPACYVYPRLKPADDKTGIFITLGQ